jgi:3-deoxy-D-manno-octulosonic-acid transferase
MNLLYNISIFFYYLSILLVSPFHAKAKKWINGRKKIFQKLEAAIPKNEKIVWFHAASLGEFEQGRPLMEAFRKQYPEFKIILTFFSPSGYEIRKNDASVDFIFYLPIDSPTNVRKFIQLVNPQMAFFIKYEYWYNYLKILKKNSIPVFIVSAIFRPSQHFFQWYGGWFRKMLKNISFFFLQNQNSAALLDEIGFSNFIISGDTRFDRVFEVAQHAKDFPLVKEFVKDSKVLIAGSTWLADEKILAAYFNENKNPLKLIIAPHEIHEEHIQQILQLFKNKTLRYSGINQENIHEADILIIDNIGILTHIYQYGHIAYIGGGFGKGIHNILEAATFGLPVVFGPNYQKFDEAKELVAREGAFTIDDIKGFNKTINELIENPDFYQNTSTISKIFVTESIGATEKILSRIKEFFPKPKN